MKNVTRRDFGLSSDVDCLQGQRNKDKYQAYQEDYHQKYGVLPEFDLINNPATAMADDIYNYYCTLKKRGFYGAWIYHDVHGYFNRELKALYSQYNKEWAFIFGMPEKVVSAMKERIRNGEGYECIQNGLGYRVENGLYYEGTWKNGQLVYGLMANVSLDTVFVGRFDRNSVKNNVLYHGVEVSVDEQKKETIQTILCGTLHMKNDDLHPYSDQALIISNSTKNGILANITLYEDGYANGIGYAKEFINGEINIAMGRYKDGDLVNDISGSIGFRFAHKILALIMIDYFMIKYTYGLFVFPIYRMIQRKKWR